MPTDKRQRHKEGRQARREAALAEARRRQRRRRVVLVIGAAAAVLVLALVVAALGGDDDDATDVAADDTTETTEAGEAREPIECETDDAGEVDTASKPDVTVPEEPPAELACTDLVVGDGEEAAVGDTIEVHYVGVSQSNGEQFDASWDNGGPVSFQLAEGSLIQGWVDGIPGMKVGGRRQLVIPAKDAYGPAGSPPAIGPNETLVFVIDLLGVEKS